MIEQLGTILREQVLGHIGVTRDVPGLNVGISGLTCILLIHQREKELAGTSVTGYLRYTSETLMDDLMDIGIRVDRNYGITLQQLQDQAFISIDVNDRYASEPYSDLLLRILDSIYPSMKGLMLIAYLVQTADEVFSERKGPGQAMDQARQALKSNGVSVPLKRLAPEDRDALREMLLMPRKQVNIDSVEAAAFSSIYRQRQEQKEKTLKHITAQMKSLGDLPVLPLNDKYVRQKINQSFSSSTDIAEILLADLGMIVNVLKSVNSRSARKPITTISHSVMVLGNEELKKIIDSFVSLDTVTDAEVKQELENSFVTAYMGHCLTQNIAEKFEIRDTEEISICSMIHNLGQIIVLYYYPEAYWQVKNLARQKRSNKRRAARTVLGTTYDAIGIHYAETWRMPFPYIESLRVCYFNRVGKTKENLIINLPFCATELCAFAGGVLDGHQTMRLKELINSLNMFSRDLGMILDKSWTDTARYARKQKISIKKRVLSEIAATG